MKSKKTKTRNSGVSPKGNETTTELSGGGDWEKRRIHILMAKEQMENARAAASKKFQTLTEYAKTALQTLMLIDSLQSDGNHIFVSKAEAVKPPEGDNSPVMEILRDRFLIRR